MASTSQLLTWIELEMHGWIREGARGSRALFNEAHRILNTGEREQNVLYDAATGDLPYFTTRDNVFQYNVPEGIWRVGGVVVDDTGELPSTVGTTRQWRFEDVQVSGIVYRRLLNVRTRDIRRGNVPTIQFVGINPTATTALYRRLAWREPIQILSDAIQHECPGDTDMRYLVPATIMLIECIDDHTKAMQARLAIEQDIKPRYLDEIDGGEQGLPDFVRKRQF